MDFEANPKRYSTPLFLFVATNAMRQGGFSALSTPLMDPFTGKPYPGNKIPSGSACTTPQDCINPVATSLLNNYLPASNINVSAAQPSIGDWAPKVLFFSHADPTVAQVILSDIATSTMTVASIVFAILLITLTLASMQFSPRIIVSFTRDRITQWTLGIFLGTFLYCMAALPAAHARPTPFAPVVTVIVRPCW